MMYLMMMERKKERRGLQQSPYLFVRHGKERRRNAFRGEGETVKGCLEGRAQVSQAHEHKHPPMIFGPASPVGGRLTSERERMQVQVFQPGHRLPTMSKEEAGLCEMEMMKKWHEKNVRIAEEANSSWHKDITAPTDVDDDTEINKGKSMGRLER
ncbi:PP2A regulatory subunit TAP46-like [Zingiber officinale]|uniref:PP2A regulatory subunit TAP46-like n=1 Tax=Zingiber officinale TaxID=94328 RepID=UPI001C4B3073|nr:PP2A regulatory subunit TAP46-like [Zingiber officinale]